MNNYDFVRYPVIDSHSGIPVGYYITTKVRTGEIPDDAWNSSQSEHKWDYYHYLPHKIIRDSGEKYTSTKEEFNLVDIAIDQTHKNICLKGKVERELK